jgi:hypothetical protein
MRFNKQKMQDYWKIKATLTVRERSSSVPLRVVSYIFLAEITAYYSNFLWRMPDQEQNPEASRHVIVYMDLIFQVVKFVTPL